MVEPDRLTDVAGLDGYGSLERRLTVWSGQRIQIVTAIEPAVQGWIRIGEGAATVPAAGPQGMPSLTILPKRFRDWAERCDWLGCAGAAR